jgi:hypothetical protein
VVAGFKDTCALIIFVRMKLESLHVGMRVRHPQYGLGTVKSISETTAEVQFNDGKRAIAPEASGLEPGEPQAAITGLDLPLSQLIQRTVAAALDGLGLEKPDAVVEQLGVRWHRGKIVLHPSDPTLQTKEVPLEVLFHKVVGIRNQLDADKVEMQQYVTRCYGSLTTFNLLFRNKEDQFSTKGE